MSHLTVGKAELPYRERRHHCHQGLSLWTVYFMLRQYAIFSLASKASLCPGPIIYNDNFGNVRVVTVSYALLPNNCAHDCFLAYSHLLTTY